MNGLDWLGAAEPKPRPKLRPVSKANLLAGLAGGLAGGVLWRKHPVLGVLGGYALTSSVHDVATGERTLTQAGERVGQAVVATAGSLALPSHPAIGYVAAAIAANLLIDEEGTGLLQEWAHRAKRLRDRPEVIDAEVVDVKPDNTTTALAKAA